MTELEEYKQALQTIFNHTEEGSMAHTVAKDVLKAWEPK